MKIFVVSYKIISTGIKYKAVLIATDYDSVLGELPVDAFEIKYEVIDPVYVEYPKTIVTIKV